MPNQTIEKYEKMLHDAGCSIKVIAHCKEVRDCACEYAQTKSYIDFSLVEGGAMLHDIGLGSMHSIAHAQESANLMRAKSFFENVARIVEYHTGAGLTADECSMLGLIPRDCIPSTMDEKIVPHIDNLCAGTIRMSIEQSISSVLYRPSKVRKRMYMLANEVELLCK